MNKNILLFTFISIMIVGMMSISAAAESLPPDRSLQVLDLLALECQKISDYSFMAQYGDTSQFDVVKRHIAVTINNVSLLMNGYDDDTINHLWDMYNQFNIDPSSAQQTADYCSSIRGEIYRKISNDERMNQQNITLNNYDDCERAGYHVNGGTCFIGGSAVFDEEGNLIGFYYSDCFDSQGFHPGSCWDCFYGADNEGCMKKP
jgi:hypothetical protein